MPIPDYQSLMIHVLMDAAQGEVRIGDVVERLANKLGLKPEERAELLQSGRQTVFANRVHWAKTYLNKAALIEMTRRGHFKIAPRGEQVLASHPSRIDNTFLAQFPEFKEFTERSMTDATQKVSNTGQISEKTTTPDEAMRLAHQQIDAALAQELLGRIYAAPPAFFERLIVTLLLKMGYGGSAADAGRALGRSGDDGVDGVIDQDTLGLDRVYIQAKRYAEDNNIGPGAIRDFFGKFLTDTRPRRACS